MSISSNGNTESQTHTNAQARTGDVVNERMAENPGSVLSSVRSRHTGRALTADEIKPDSLVSVEGMQTTIAAAEVRGVLARDENGRYVDTNVPILSDEDNTSQTIDEIEHGLYALPTPVQTVVDVALAGLPDLIGEQTVFHALLGNPINYDALESRTGRAAAELAADVQVATTGIVTHLAQTLGITPQQTGELLATADASEGQEYVKDALRHLVVDRNSQKFMTLAKKAMRSLAPTAEQLEAAGHKTRRDPVTGKTLVSITEGEETYWVDVAVAANLQMV